MAYGELSRCKRCGGEGEAKGRLRAVLGESLEGGFYFHDECGIRGELVAEDGLDMEEGAWV